MALLPKLGAEDAESWLTHSGCCGAEGLPSPPQVAPAVSAGEPAAAEGACPQQRHAEVLGDLLQALGEECQRLVMENENLRAHLHYPSAVHSPAHMLNKRPSCHIVFESSEEQLNPDPGGQFPECEMELQMGPNTTSCTEEKYERLYDLTRTFNRLCSKHRTSISIREIMQMHANQQGLCPLHDVISDLAPRYESCTMAINGCLDLTARKAVSMSLTSGTKDVHLDTFMAIMNPTHVAAKVSGEVLEIAGEIKSVFVREEACRKVAQATQTRAHELYDQTEKKLRPIETALKYLDPFIGFVILLNGIFVSISTDVEGDRMLWALIEGSFTVIFTLELIFKVIAKGPKTFFLGQEFLWNTFDTLIMGISFVDLILTLSGSMISLGNFSTVRLLRFLRLTKLVRVLKLKMFRELSVMVSGIVAGLRTLLWAIVFLTFLLFILGVFGTQVVGHRRDPFINLCIGMPLDRVEDCHRSAAHLAEHGQELFGNILRSMFTIFRCFTDGCSSVDGTPLIPYFMNTYGIISAVAYTLVMLFVIFGLFNLIMSTFVETTISNNSHNESLRYNEHVQIAQKLQQLIVMFCTTTSEGDNMQNGDSDLAPTLSALSFAPKNSYKSATRWLSSVKKALSTQSDEDEARPTLSDLSTGHMSLEVTHEDFMRVLQKPEVENLLDDLDISIASRHALFDILDANNNGTLEVSEMVQGLLRLRSSADKGNIVASLLAIRSVQKTLKAVEGLSVHQHKAIQDLQLRMEKEAKMEHHRRHRNVGHHGSGGSHGSHGVRSDDLFHLPKPSSTEQRLAAFAHVGCSANSASAWRTGLNASPCRPYGP